jgi:UDP-N-acetylglucosamine--N-acetylmuramyl-(pentapeptide) pyrophosphoryl-undecaprenol N-acetylglucosamine transferase
MEGELVRREELPFIGIPGGGVHGVALLHAVRNGWDLARAVFVARKHLRRESPAVILTTGGYVSGPVALAARWESVPVVVFVPDIEPAQSIKTIARSAARICVTVPDSLSYFAGDKGVVTGYPLGRRITDWTRTEGCAVLGLNEEAPVLLVFGGSRGARSINRAVIGDIEGLAALAQVVHVTGTLDWPEVEAVREGLPASVRERYTAYPYLHQEMGAALAAADLIVSRSGAGVLGEFTHFGVPAVLVPYPHAWRYQRVNAGWLADRGAAVIVEDAELAGELLPTATRLLTDKTRLSEMSASARRLARPNAAHAVAQQMLVLGQGLTPASI